MPENQPAAPPKEQLVERPLRADEDDLELLRACFAKNNDRPRAIELLRWQYLDSPTGKLFVDVALAPGGQRIAAVYASLAGYMRVRGKRRLSLQSLDTLTDVDFRGRGLFVKLAKKTFARAAEDGAALIYGFPNGSSAHGFFKKLAWSPLDPVPFLIRPLRLSYFAERLKLPRALRALAPQRPLVLASGRRRPNVVDIARADARLTRLWDRFAEGAGVGVAIERDEAYFRWRLFQKPFESYRVIATERGGELSSLCAFTVKDKHGGRIGYVMELLHEPGAQADARHLLGIAVREMADDAADSVLAWCMPHSPTFKVFARHAFLPMPERMRAIELHAGVRAFDPDVASVVRERAAWYLSYLDSDTV